VRIPAERLIAVYSDMIDWKQLRMRADRQRRRKRGRK
jgi:hypothetical protein